MLSRNIIKLGLYLFAIIAYFSLFNSSVSAAVLFQDNFDDGNDDGWTRISENGQSHLWHVDSQGRYGALVSSGSTIIDSVISDESWSNYSFEMDMTPVQGEDKNIRLKWNSSIGFCTQFHFNGGGVHYGGHTSPISLNNNQTYKIKVVMSGSLFELLIDDDLVASFSAPQCASGKIGLTVSTGATAPTEVYFDNIIVKTLDDEGETSLNVPLLKQTDPLWGSQVYDTADVWSNSGTGISQWGCAMTSAAMVFKYHGINTLPDGTTPLDPGTLNSWLKSQSDGYVSGGLVNWLALSRLSRLAPHTGGGVFDALEYSRVGGTNIAQLSSDLQDGIPDILEEPGHFIVAKGETDTSFAINDPYYARELLSDYGNTFVSLRQFKPSLTDLSYLMFVVDEDVDIHLFDSESNEIGEQYIQEPITDPSGQASTNGGSVKMLHFQKPDSGQYTVVISSNTSNAYVLQSYEYDENGNVKQGSFSGVVGNGNSDTYLLNFSKENSNNSTVEPYVTFSSLKNDIKTYYSLGKIKKYVVYKLLLLKVELAENLSRHSKRATKALLTIVKAEIQKEKGKSITTDAANSLLGQLGILTAQY